MPLTQNTYVGLADDPDIFDAFGNWSLGHTPNAAEEAFIDYNSDGSLNPDTTIDPSTVGALTVESAGGDGLDFDQLSVLGDVFVGGANSIELEYLGGTFASDGFIFGGVTIHTFDGSIAFSQVQYGNDDTGTQFNLTVGGGTGTIVCDAPIQNSNDSSTLSIDPSFAGAFQNTSGDTIDLSETDTGEITLGSSVRLLPDRAAFIGFTGGAPDALNNVMNVSMLQVLEII